MTPTVGAGTENRFGEGPKRTLAVLIAVLLLSVQIGLTYHGAAHVREVDQTGDCDFCDLGSHFVAEPAPDQELDTIPRIAIYLPLDSVPFPDSALQTPLARGPPLTSI